MDSAAIAAALFHLRLWTLVMAEWFRRFIRDDSAQDVVEYAYLALFVGLAGLAVWTGIVALLGQHYAAANHGVQDLWEYEGGGGS